MSVCLWLSVSESVCAVSLPVSVSVQVSVRVSKCVCVCVRACLFVCVPVQSLKWSESAAYQHHAPQICGQHMSDVRKLECKLVV